MKLVTLGSVSVTSTFARGCGNCLVAVHGIVNIRWTGIESACAQWMCAKLGGFAIIASATKGSPVFKSGLTQDSQQPWSISAIILRFFEMSPARMDSTFGMIPGFLTMYLKLLVGSIEGRRGDVRPLIRKGLHRLDRIQGLICERSLQIHYVLQVELGGRFVVALGQERQKAAHHL